MILVLGSGGQLGTAMQHCLPADRAVFIDRPDVDLADAESMKPLAEIPFTGLINCAAYTAVDEAESNESVARRINAEAVGELAALAASRGAAFVTYSTDYVFDGMASRPYVEGDATAPLNAYGRTKLAGELAALAAHSSALVIRTSWLVSGTHRNFLTAILDRARAGDLDVVDDQHGCPTIASDLAAATLSALQAGITGTLHLTNHGPTTWFGLAREAVRCSGLDAERVSPCDSSRFPRPAARPANSVLGTERRGQPGVPTLRPWREALPAVVQELIDRPPA